jgi:hypothetical protein
MTHNRNCSIIVSIYILFIFLVYFITFVLLPFFFIKMENSTEIYSLLDTFLNEIGLSKYHEQIFLSLIPLGFFGIAFNILVLITLKKNSLRLAICQYMHIYTFNSTLVCAITMTSFIFTSRRYFHFSNTHAAHIYLAYFFLPVTNIAYTFSEYMDCLLLFDRIILLYGGLPWYRRISPNKVCLAIFLISCIISTPNFFLFTPYRVTWAINQTEPLILHGLSISSFRETNSCNILLVISNFVSNVMPLLIKIIFTVKIVVLLKKFSNRMKNLNPPSCAAGRKLRRSEMKMTVVVIVLTVLSIM